MNQNTNEKTIDATNKAIGRLASEVAVVLMGKDKTDYQPNIVNGDKVKVINVEKAKLTGKKETNQIYYRHTGYPGGIKSKTPADMTRKQLLEKVLFNMLPKNKLRNELLKRLTIE